MKILLFPLTTGIALVEITTNASAHVGHLGELAGHSHWIGLGAVIVAGAIAVAVGKFAESKKDDEEEPEAEPVEEKV